MFHYTPQDAIARIYPWRGYSTGNEKVKVYVSYFHDKTNPEASCKFTYRYLSHTVNVIDFDEESVTCYAPPAYLFSNELVIKNGETTLTVSSNGVDFSDDTAHIFDYLQPVIVTKIHPPFILLG